MQQREDLPSPKRNYKGLLEWDLYMKKLTDRDVPQVLELLSPEIRVLNLGVNQIGDEGATALANGLKTNSSLTTIHLYNNQIKNEGATALADMLKTNSTLTTIYLGNNQIGVEGGKALYASLAYNTHLQELKISYGYIPREFQNQSLDFVRKYYQDLGMGSASVTSLKVLLVGFGGRGKTSLVQSLQKPIDGSKSTKGNKESNNPPATDGVDIQSWKLEDLYLSLWDFAGQQTYYVTHPLFLSNEAVYLLVWNMRENDPMHELEYWLQSIAAKAPQSAVILVGTHKDKGMTVKPPASLSQRFPGLIKAKLGVSNLNQEGIPELKETLLEVGRTHKKKLPSSYISLLEFFQSQEKKKYLKWKDVKQQMLSSFNTKDQMKRAISTLHTLGHVLYYSEIPELKKYVLLDPQWLIDHLKTIVTANNETSHWVKEGWLDHSQLPNMWPTLNKKSLRDFLLNAMHHSRIAIPMGDRSFVPSRLASESPQPFPKAPLCRRFEFKQGEHPFLPLDIFPAAMTEPKLQLLLMTDRCWKEGAFFGLNGQLHFLLQVVGNSFELKGNGPNWILHQITKTIQELAKRWPGIILTVFLPCPLSECGESTFRLGMAQKEYEENPLGTLKCMACGNETSLQDLLHLSEFRKEDIENVESIGEGTFGQVSSVRHKLTGATYAAKTQKTERKDQLEALKKELLVLSSLPKHPNKRRNIISLLGWHQEGLEITLYMPKFPFSLDKLLNRLRTDMIKAHTSQSVAEWSQQILSGLQVLHQHNIAHRDLKSANILVTLKKTTDDKEGKSFQTIRDLVITDFGSAKEVLQNTSSSTALPGTPGYMAPEAYIPNYEPFKADVYSFGIVLFELLTASKYPPPVDKNAPEGPKPFSVKTQNKFGEWEALYHMCTSQDPNSRPDIQTIMDEIDYITGKKGRPSATSLSVEAASPISSLMIKIYFNDKIRKKRINPTTTFEELRTMACKDFKAEQGKYVLLDMEGCEYDDDEKVLSVEIDALRLRKE